jgi:hypothetical protein
MSLNTMVLSAVLATVCSTHGAVVLDRSMRTVAHAVKGVSYKPSDNELEFFSFPAGEAGVITEQWWSVFGGDAQYSSGADPTIRIYYDANSTAPSLEYRLFMAHGAGLRCVCILDCVPSGTGW